LLNQRLQKHPNHHLHLRNNQRQTDGSDGPDEPDGLDRPDGLDGPGGPGGPDEANTTDDEQNDELELGDLRKDDRVKIVAKKSPEKVKGSVYRISEVSTKGKVRLLELPPNGDTPSGNPESNLRAGWYFAKPSAVLKQMPRGGGTDGVSQYLGGAYIRAYTRAETVEQQQEQEQEPEEEEEEKEEEQEEEKEEEEEEGAYCS
jgi:hypothetical protein